MAVPVADQDVHQPGPQKIHGIDSLIGAVLQRIEQFGSFDDVTRSADARAMRFETVGYAWDTDNPLSGKTPTIKDLSVHA